MMAARFVALFAAFALCAGLAAVACSPASAPRAQPMAPTNEPSRVASSSTGAGAPLVHVQILAINDFHGALEPPAGSNGMVVVSADDPLASSPDARRTDAGVTLLATGGAAYLASHVEQLRADNPLTVVVSAGDLTGASPLLSNLFGDEPTILVMNRLGLDLEAVGNHDFDHGLAELMRLQKPGCSRDDCDGGTYVGASFEYLAANVVDDATGRPVLAPYAVRQLGDARVAFIGETLSQTPMVTAAAGVKGLTFADEAATANALVPELQARGVSAIVLLLHQGGMQSAGGTYDGCKDFSGDLVAILNRLSPAIDVVVSGHTHQAYDCTIGGRLVTSAASNGRLLTKIDLTLDPSAHRVVEKHARNVPITREVTPDPQVDALVSRYRDLAHIATERVVGYVKNDVTGNVKAAGSASCETPLGDVIADGMRDATGADFAFMNPGGIRADLVARRKGRPEFAVTYADAFDVQPFGNALVTMTLTGADVKALLEAQFGGRSEPRILQVSRGFSYRYACGANRRTAAVTDLRLYGKRIEASKEYRVTVPSFLASGGDGFAILKSGTNRTEGALDVDALTAYLGKVSSPKAPLEPVKPSRIEGDGCR